MSTIDISVYLKYYCIALSGHSQKTLFSLRKHSITLSENKVQKLLLGQYLSSEGTYLFLKSLYSSLKGTY